MSDPSEPEYEVRDDVMLEKIAQWRKRKFRNAPDNGSGGWSLLFILFYYALVFAIFVWACFEFPDSESLLATFFICLPGTICAFTSQAILWSDRRKFGKFVPADLIKVSDTRAIRHFMEQCYGSDQERRRFFTPAVTRLLNLQLSRPMEAVDVSALLKYVRNRDWKDDDLTIAVLNRLGEFGDQEALRVLNQIIAGRWFLAEGEFHVRPSQIRTAIIIAQDKIAGRIIGTRQSGMLLRPAEAGNETLLRPVGVGDVNPDELLRPVSND